MDILLEVIKTNGVVAAIAVYMIYQSRRDHRAVCDRLNTVEDYVKNQLVEIIEKTTKAIDQNTSIMTKCHKQ